MDSAPSLEPPAIAIIPSYAMGFDPTVDPTDDEYDSGNNSEEGTDIDDEIINTERERIDPDSLGCDQKRIKKDPEPIEAHTLEHNSPLFSYDEFQNLDLLFSFADAFDF
jgi:hypothetical protein